MNSRSHARWSEQLPAYLLGGLNPTEKAEIEHHVGGCPLCQAELLWLAPAADEIATSVPQVEAPAGLKQRIMAEVAADAEIAEAMDPSRSGRPVKQSGGLRALLRPAMLGAVAAVLFAGLAIGYAVNGGDSGTGLDDGPSTTITGKSNIGANAVLVRTGDSGTLKVADLKKLDEGEVYQAWIQHGQSVIPTDSLFTPDRNGNATASIPDLAGVSAVLVSTEPAGGSKQPTTTPIITVDLS